MTRDEMLTEMIHLYGFEHKVVIQFAQAMESPYISDHTLELLVKLHKEFPQFEEEDE